MEATLDPELLQRIRERVAQRAPALTALRRDLHAHPELRYEERRTAGVIREALDAAGVAHADGLAGGTGTLGHLAGGDGPATALRADIDALPIVEQTGLPYASTHEGRMHACGHDGHTAILIGAAQVLGSLAAEGLLPRPVLFCFQPAEEGGHGARRMLEDQALDGVGGAPLAAEIFGLHGWPDLPLGQVGSRRGALLASSDAFEITVRGEGGHAAQPDRARDAVLASAAITVALQQLLARELAPGTPAVLSVTQLHAGSAHNVIPDSAFLNGTLRACDEATRAQLQARLREVAERTAAAHRCEAEVTLRQGYPPTINDEALLASWRQVAGAQLGADDVIAIERPAMVAEDFSYYAQTRPALFFALGVRPPAQPTMPGLHHPRFDFNDDAIAIGVELFCRLACRPLG